MRNFHYHQKYPFGAPCRHPLAPTIFFHNLPLILPKRFHNHVDAARGRRQYHFETYFYYKTYERSKNRHFHVKLSLSSEISIWRAAAAPARTCNCFQNLPIIFSKQFHNHIGAHEPWQWRFAIYCGHKTMTFSLSPEIPIWRGVSGRTHLQLLSKHILYIFKAVSYSYRCVRKPIVPFWNLFLPQRLWKN